MDTNKIVLSNEQALNMMKACLKLGEVKKLAIPEAIEIFLKIKTVETTRTATIDYYSQLLNLTKTYLFNNQIIFTDQINNDTIMKYVSYLIINNKSKCYINKLATSLIQMLNKLSSHDYINTYNFTYKKLKEDVKEIKVLDNKQITKIMNYIETKSTIHHLTFRLFFETGIRRTEITKIKFSNINIKEKKIYLDHTKNHESRYIFISDITINLINDMYNNKKEHTEYLLYNFRTGEPITTSFIDKLFANTKKDLDFSNLGPHLLRHTFCTAIARSNVDIKSIQTLMGHKTLSMTMRYIQLVEQDELANTSVNNNPLSKLE